MNQKWEPIYSKFEYDHPVLFQNNLIRLFFNHSTHKYLLCLYLEQPTEDNLKNLEEAFKHFYFQMRFTKYLCSIIKFTAIDFARKRKRVTERNPLIFDQPINTDEGITLGEFLSKYVPADDDHVYTNLDQLVNAFDNKQLYTAFISLTEKQKYILLLSYARSFMDTEIARLMHISQQAVFKSRTAVLKKMKKIMTSPKYETY